MPVTSLAELESVLANHSHTEVALREVEAFSAMHRDTKERLKVWNGDRVLLRQPIECDHCKQLGFDRPEDVFAVLQGDIVSTEATRRTIKITGSEGDWYTTDECGKSLGYIHKSQVHVGSEPCR